MAFQEGGNQPCCMTPQERVATNSSQYDAMPLKDKTKDEFLVNH